MDSELKRAMRFMWGINKRIRRSFGCGFRLLGNGGMLLIIAIAMSVPLFAKLLGMNISGEVRGWAYTAALFGQIMTQVIVFECTWINHDLMGKGMGGFPFARWMMTKGIIINLLIYHVCSLVLMLGINKVSMAVGATDASLADDLLYLSGFFFFLQGLLQVLGGLLDRWNKSVEYFVGIIPAFAVIIPDEVGNINRSVEAAALLYVVFMVCGVLLMYLYLVRKYKRRSGARLQN